MLKWSLWLIGVSEKAFKFHKKFQLKLCPRKVACQFRRYTTSPGEIKDRGIEKDFSWRVGECWIARINPPFFSTSKHFYTFLEKVGGGWRRNEG